MFLKGEYVVHGSTGICQVTDIIPMDPSGKDRNKKYYLLIPVNEKGSKIYIPVDRENSKTRRILSKEEAWKLIEQIPDMEESWIENDKMREAQYKETIKNSDCTELVKMIKELYTRKMKRIAEGKKSTATDERYFKIAEENLYTELSYATGKSREEMPALIAEKVGQRDGSSVPV